MRMGTCSVRTTGGPLAGADPVLRSPKPRRRGLKLELFDLRERVRPGFRLWFLRVFSLFGLTRMAGKELLPPSLPCNYSFLLISLYVYVSFYILLISLKVKWRMIYLFIYFFHLVKQVSVCLLLFCFMYLRCLIFVNLSMTRGLYTCLFIHTAKCVCGGFGLFYFYFVDASDYFIVKAA